MDEIAISLSLEMDNITFCCLGATIGTATGLYLGYPVSCCYIPCLAGSTMGFLMDYAIHGQPGERNPQVLHNPVVNQPAVMQRGQNNPLSPAAKEWSTQPLHRHPVANQSADMWREQNDPSPTAAVLSRE